MENLESLSRELERSGKAEGIKKLAQSREGMKISQMVDRQTAESAAKSGDAAAMRNIISDVLSTEEGKRLAEELMKLMQD